MGPEIRSSQSSLLAMIEKPEIEKREEEKGQKNEGGSMEEGVKEQKIEEEDADQDRYVYVWSSNPNHQLRL